MLIDVLLLFGKFIKRKKNHVHIWARHSWTELTIKVNLTLYKLIKNIKGIKFVETKYNSLELIKNSLFIATITGSVAIEASILGKKSLAFGKPWYMGCPNTFIWDADITYNQLIHSPLEPISSFNICFILLHGIAHVLDRVGGSSCFFIA